MSLTPPPPPSITPKQMTLLRIVASMAWADGHLSQEEMELMLDNFSQIFAQEAQQQQQLREELRDYLLQNIPLETLVPQLDTQEDRELALKLSYEVIASSSRSPDEPKINSEEATAYAKLVMLLDLPDAVVCAIESEVDQDPPTIDLWMETVRGELHQLA